MQFEKDPDQAIDDLLKETYSSSEPGAAVIVVRDGEILVRKGYGMASLELEVPISPDMVFRIGSVTKQFTAVAVLILAEQGKLALDDPLSKFLPDYPHGSLVTVENLLTHTSGIRSYTDMPEFLPLIGKEVTVQELIDGFKDQPMAFPPGTRFAYSNSGYFLLGAIIEKVSGKTYADFIEQNIFKPLGMNRSFYDDPLRVIPRRAAGYTKDLQTYMNAPSISMKPPYAAGGLASTVDDLALWDTALYTEQLLKQQILQRAFTPYRLIDGSYTPYGYGWGIKDYKGHRIVEHGGGISGFMASVIRIPDDRIFVAVLSNIYDATTDPGPLAFKIAAWTLGQPYQEPGTIELSSEVLARYEGVYQINELEQRIIAREGNRLFHQRGRQPRRELLPIANNEFVFKESPFYRLRFVTDANDTATSLILYGQVGHSQMSTKVNRT